MTRKIGVRPYVQGPDPGNDRKGHPRRLCWGDLPAVLGQLLARLRPGVQRRYPLLFGLELATVVCLAVTLAALWGWVGASLLASLVVVDIHLLVILLAANLVLALGEWRRQHAAAAASKTLPRLAYRVAGSTTSAVAVRVSGLADVIDVTGGSNGYEIDAIDARDLQEGDVILVDAGQLIPADGNVLAGVAVVDEAAVTGESGLVLREAERASEVMRETRVTAGCILVMVAARRGHPLDWIA